MLTMKRSGDSTHPCRSPTPAMNGRDFILPKRKQTPEREYSDLAASNRRPSTPWSRNTPQSFLQGTRLYGFSRSTKYVKTSLAYSEDFSKFCWRVKCGLYCYGLDHNRTGCHSGLIQLCCGVFSQGIWQIKCWLFENSQKASRAAFLRPIFFKKWEVLIAKSTIIARNDFLTLIYGSFFALFYTPFDIFYSKEIHLILKYRYLQQNQTAFFCNE